MEFISINFSLNQIYQVEKSVFEDVSKEAVKKVKGVKFVSADAELSKNNDDVSITISITKDAKLDLTKTFTSVTNEIEMLVFNLLDSKPNNIKIKLV